MATRSSVSPGPGSVTKTRVPSRAPATPFDVDMFGMIAALCGAGLVIAMLLATYGIDLSDGFF
jgi:hypothetical protein